MRLYFVRHGESENNELYRRTGSDEGRSHDPKLTDIGWKQAQATANFLATHRDPVGDMDETNYGITHVYSSLMVRALSTASVIGQRLGVKVIPWKDWHENGGIYLDDRTTNQKIGLPGLCLEEIRENFPDVILDESIPENGWWDRPYEEREERPVRARRVLYELLDRHGGTDDRVLVVSHGGFYMNFLAAVLGVEEIVIAWFQLNNCGITRIDFMDGDRRIVYHNFLCHLSDRAEVMNNIFS
ncbi:fructose-2,6-bisphosphatase [Anaerolinea thermolimosa]|uniref:histidine phosphatase family protein n=1 Tax=Anaerolinea thermolimosa TaxID=229919 RepID=UPI000783ECBC|nr:histidine phosphatase family protein [Anaerolinea thermolimosa]GAP06497.1 fructose-2,6-bisphosphatase [Anaerolinea thermolimosa]